MKTRLLSATLVLAFTPVALAFAQTATSANCPTAPMMDHGKSENGKPLLSPPAEVSTKLAGKSIDIHYNKPSLRCRTVGNEIAPYGKIWRTGANPATSFVTEGDVKIGDLFVPAGSYTLYTLPAAPGTPWLFIVNKQTGQWGTEYKPEMDLGRVPMKYSALPKPQEVMSIWFQNATDNSLELHIRWGTTDVSVKVEATK